MLSPVMVSGGDCKSLVLVPSLFESESIHQIWLVSIMVITADCLSAYGSSILPRVASYDAGRVWSPARSHKPLPSLVRIQVPLPNLQLITASVIRTRETDWRSVGWFWSTQPALATRQFYPWRVGGGHAWWRNWCDVHKPEVNWCAIITTTDRKHLILN
jgi:hypothetical protein